MKLVNLFEKPDVTKSPSFISWFGDTSNDAKSASKVTKNGEPLLVQHKSVVSSLQKDLGITIFSSDFDDTIDKNEFIYNAYLKITNPKKVSYEDAINPAIQQKAKLDGHDGFIIDDKSFAIFDLKQVWLVK